jgi:uncharacterized protein YegP (UPF0339 family)
LLAYYMYRDVTGAWRWYLSAGNGRKLADSGQGYTNRGDCLKAITMVRQSGAALVYDV